MITPEHLTAHVLQELPEPELAAVQAELETAPELRAAEQELADFCGLLTDHLGSEKLGLRPEQRSALLAGSHGRRTAGLTMVANASPSTKTSALTPRHVPVWRQPAVRITAAAAAVVALLITQLRWQDPDQSEAVAEVKPSSEDVHISLGQPKANNVPTNVGQGLTPSKPSSIVDQTIAQTMRQSLPPLDAAQPKGALLPPKSAQLALVQSDQVLFQNDAKGQQPDGLYDTKTAGRSFFSLTPSIASWTTNYDHLKRGMRPQPASVRVEEFVAAFASSNQPAAKEPRLLVEITDAPWDPSKRLARVELRAGDQAALAELSGMAEFNPFQVSSYRLLSYENRSQQAQQTAVPAGKLSAGATAVALYELVPLTVIVPETTQLADTTSEQKKEGFSFDAKAPQKVFTPTAELAAFSVKYRDAAGAAQQLNAAPVASQWQPLDKTSGAARLSAAATAMALKLSGQADSLSWEAIATLARSAGAKSHPRHAELLDAIQRAAKLQ
jgi:hypothetical protein